MAYGDIGVRVRFIEGGKSKTRVITLSGASHRSDDEIAATAMDVLSRWSGTTEHEVISFIRNDLGEEPYTGHVKRKFLVSLEAIVTLSVWERDEAAARARAEQMIMAWQGIEKAATNQVSEVRNG